MAIYYVLCEMESYFVPEFDRSRYRVVRPLQFFVTKDRAEEALELFMEFYNFNLRVVRSDELHEEFR